LLNRSHFEAAEHAVAKAWPHSRAPTGEFGQCSGSVDKARWLNTSTRAQARVRADRKQKNKGAEVVAAVLRMVGLSYRFNKLIEAGDE
jgi:hypothetical protein